MEYKMKKLSVFLTILGVLFLIISCETDNLPTNAEKSSSIEQFDNDVDKIEISESDLALLNNYTLEKSSDNEQRDAVVDEVLLKYFAMAMAKSLKHPDICKILKNKIGEKFDGDYDVLWEQIKNKRISGRDLRVLVESRFSERTRKLLPITKIEEIPLLQVALPVNFDDWDGESAILVAYTPLTKDDMEWEEIYAYDANLKEYILDAKTEPDFPVMVVGINERTDKEGNVVISTLAKSLNMNSRESVNSTSELTDEILVYMRFLRNYNDVEPWTSGDPEVRLSISGIDNNGGAHNDMEYHSFDGTFNTYWTWTGVHYDKRWKHPNIGIYTRDPSIYGKGAVLFWFESDGESGTASWSHTEGGTTVTTTEVKSGYDKIGKRFISYDLPPSYYGNQSSPCYYGDLFCNVLIY